MSFPNFADVLGEEKIVPVVVLDSAKDAVKAAEALVAGGIKTAEITFRTEAAAESIAMISRECPEITVGAGTIITAEQAEIAIDSGSKFLVSPGFSTSIAEVARKNNIAFLPGAINPTQIMQCLEMGLDIVKFFPAQAMGGLATVKALSAPFPQVKFVPTGGVGESNLTSWLENPAILAVGGSWMITREMIQNEDFSLITEKSQKAVSLLRS